MAYKTAKLDLSAQSIAGRRTWLYSDTGATVANAVAAGGFFTNAREKGAKTGDSLIFTDETNAIRVTGLLTVQDTGQTNGVFIQDTH